MTIEEYQKEISQATTKEELRQITYKAFLQDDNALDGKRSLYDKVVTLCVKREEELERIKEEQKMKVRIYQICSERDQDNLLFRGYDFIREKTGGRIPEEIYELVYDSELEVFDLEHIYHMLNVARPSDYKARSLSVSDIVEIVRSPEKSSFHFCDSFGFQEIQFDKTKVTGVKTLPACRECMCNGCPENKTSAKNGMCSGCDDCGKPNQRCLRV